MLEIMWFDIVGIIGVCAAMSAFLLVLRGKMNGVGLWFPAINAGACLAVLISLYFIFNLSAFVTEIGFLIISCYGIIHYFVQKRKRKHKELIEEYRDTNICVYLASPYTHPLKEVMKRRYLTITHMSAYLSSLGVPHFCPITQSHVEQEVKPDLETSWNYWQKVDTEMVKRMDELWICSMKNIENSVGVKAEFNIAQNLKKPIKLLAYNKETGYILSACRTWEDVIGGLKEHGKIDKRIVEQNE